MTFNNKDLIWYGTNAERLEIVLATDTRFPNTEKFYEVDTKLAYIVYNGAWYEV